MINISIVLYKNSDCEVINILNNIIKSELVNKIYLIDNSPTDILGKIIKSNLIISNQKLTYIYNNKNLGYGAGHNIAIRKSIIEKVLYHLVINSDIYFDINIFSILVSYLNNNPDVALASPKIIDQNGNIQYNCKLVPSPMDLISRIIFPKAIYTKKRNNILEMKRFNYEKEIYSPYLSGCFMFLRITSLETIGLFDERFFMYPEDIDLTRRLAEHFRTMYLPCISITHDHRKASFKSLTMLLIHSYNMILYFNKWGWIFDSKKIKLNNKIINWNNNGSY